MMEMCRILQLYKIFIAEDLFKYDCYLKNKKYMVKLKYIETQLL